MTIPINPVHIDPQIAQQRFSDRGLADFIEALQLRKQNQSERDKMALEGQRLGIAQQQANTTEAYRTMEAAKMQAALDQRAQAEVEWQKAVDKAPESIKPLLAGLHAMDALPANVQDLAGKALKQALFPDHPDPQIVQKVTGLLHLSMPLGMAANLAGMPTENIPKAWLNWKYTPPGEVDRHLKDEATATGKVFTQADTEIKRLEQAAEKEKQNIAKTVMQKRAGGKLLLTQPTFDPSDPEMTGAFHSWLTQKAPHLNDLRRDREAARQKMLEIGKVRSDLGTGNSVAPEEDRINQILQLMGGASGNDSTSQQPQQ